METELRGLCVLSCMHPHKGPLLLLLLLLLPLLLLLFLLLLLLLLMLLLLLGDKDLFWDDPKARVSQPIHDLPLRCFGGEAFQSNPP